MAGNVESNHLPASAWFSRQPFFFVTPFVPTLGLLTLLLARPRTPATRRLLVASSAWCLTLFTIFAVWQFASTGWLFQLAYYWSSFLIPSLVCLAAVVATLYEAGAFTRRQIALGAVLTGVAVLIPLVWIYASDSSRRVADGFTRGAYLYMFVAMAIALFLVIAWRIARTRIAVLFAIAIAFFAFTYGISTSFGTFPNSASAGDTGDLSALGQKLIDHLHKRGYVEPDNLPYFWFDVADPVEPLASLQALYFWDYTRLGMSMPLVDADFRRRIAEFRPAKLVLLCSDRTCKGAARALARSGYPSRTVSHKTLRSGRLTLYVVELEQLRFVGVPPFYRDARPLVRRPGGQVVYRATFTTPLPNGWSATRPATVHRVPGGIAYTTTPNLWEYQLVGPTTKLAPGRYVVSLRGRVLRGGLMLGVLDTATKEWSAYSLYWSGQAGFGGKVMATTLNLSRPLVSRVVLSNWAEGSVPSRWIVGTLEIHRTP
jgi:hypothetical protein